MQLVAGILLAFLFMLFNEVLGLDFLPSVFFTLITGGALAFAGASLLDGIAKRHQKEADRIAQSNRSEIIRAHFAAHPDHVRTLKQIYDRTVYKDEFGDYRFDGWFAQRDKYIKEKMGRPITDCDDDFDFITEFDDQLDALWDKLPPESNLFNRTRTPSDGLSFEKKCHALLLKQGFDVRMTPATGDHGADLIARKGRYSLAIQCKNHGKPVGNHAVMEAESARQFYDCTNAVVVSDSGFTTAARQHANKVGVTLLDSHQLSRLRKAMLFPPRQEDSATL